MRDRTLRSLSRNPAIPGDLLRQIVDERLRWFDEELETRPAWTDDQFDALAGHPDGRVRTTLAMARGATPDQRARLVEDPHPGVLAALVYGPHQVSLWNLPPTPPLPGWAYHRLIERDPRLRDEIGQLPWAPPELRAKPPAPPAQSAPRARSVDADAHAMAHSPDPHTREAAALLPDLPADLVALLAADPSPAVRLQVSMRPELTEAERAAIDYHVGPDTFARWIEWVSGSQDPDVLHRCVHSAHPGLRRAAAMNRRLPPDLVAILARDDDSVVRLLLCETHADVPSDVVVDAYLRNDTFSRHRLLAHPNFSAVGLARLADSPNPSERVEAALDPELSPDVVDRLSRDPVDFVRARVADDPRLAPERVLELFDDPATSIDALRNPHLPVAVMRQVFSRSS